VLELQLDCAPLSDKYFFVLGQMDMWGAMNNLVSLGSAPNSEDQALYTQRIMNQTDRLAFYQLSLLLGNANFSTVYSQAPSEVRARFFGTWVPSLC
jgi:hypothetical protein